MDKYKVKGLLMRIGKTIMGRVKAAAPTPIKIGLFCGGNNYSDTPPRTYVDKYTFASDTVTAGTVMRTASTSPVGSSNTTTAISVAGSVTDIYTYTADTWVAGANFNGTPTSNAAFGMSTRVICQKSTGQEASALLESYSYSGASWSSATSLNTQQSGSPAANTTATTGYVSGGYGVGYVFLVITQKYTYSSNTVSTGGSMGTSRYSVTGCGNTTYGLIAGGNPLLSTNQKYTYATDVVSATTALFGGAEAAGGAANPVVGLIAGGFVSGGGPAGSSVVRKYTWSSDASSAGTSLGLARARPQGASSEPGAF